MNIKYGIAWLGLLILLLCWSCVDDRGNYTYQDPETVLPVKISGLQDTTFRIMETVTLVPELEGLENEDDYWFTWYTYKGGTGIPVRDTIGRTRNLTFRMMYPAGEYRTLIYEIKDKKTGVFVNARVSMVGVAEFNKGWLVLNHENDQTDIDFGFPDGSVQEDILWEKQGLKLQGTAVAIAYQGGNYYNEVTNPDGTVTLTENLRAWHVLSSRDMMSLNPDNLSAYKHWNDEFYVVPEIAAPQDIYNNWGDNVLINAGQLHSINGNSSNLGKFGFPKLNYQNLFPAMVNDGKGNTLAFSRDSRSFVMTHVYLANLDTLFPPKAGNLQISSTHMNADMLALVQGGENAYALMKSVSGPEEYYLADIKFNVQEYPFAGFDTIPASLGLVNADVYAAHRLNSIYFAKGNVLSYYSRGSSVALSYEKTDLYPFPEGETISWIRQVSAPWMDVRDAYALIVITNSSNGWKLYRFELEGDGLSPNLKPGTKPVVWSGKGFARYAVWLE